VTLAPEAASAFATRDFRPEDMAFIRSTFELYRLHGHTLGVRDIFAPLVGDPFERLARESRPGPMALVSTLVVYPTSEPTEIAGYVVFSPRHQCLVYLCTKEPYQRMGVATGLLAMVPRKTVQVGPMITAPVLLHCFSTSRFGTLMKANRTLTRYSPFLFARLVWELQEDTRV
jgi:hypothetical protein